MICGLQVDNKNINHILGSDRMVCGLYVDIKNINQHLYLAYNTFPQCRESPMKSREFGADPLSD